MHIRIMTEVGARRRDTIRLKIQGLLTLFHRRQGQDLLCLFPSERKSLDAALARLTCERLADLLQKTFTFRVRRLGLAHRLSRLDSLIIRLKDRIGQDGY